jgi:hypothetical protein
MPDEQFGSGFLAIVCMVAAGLEKERLDPVGETDFRFATGPYRLNPVTNMRMNKETVI